MQWIWYGFIFCNFIAGLSQGSLNALPKIQQVIFHTQVLHSGFHCFGISTFISIEENRVYLQGSDFPHIICQTTAAALSSAISASAPFPIYHTIPDPTGRL